MLVVSMVDRRVLRIEPDDSVVVHADLSEIATWHTNDMIVLRDGSAFVGNFGFCLYPPSMPRTAALARVSPSGDATIAAEGLWFPNGMVITPDGSTLIVAESGTRQLTAFDLNSNGGLSGRRLWAALPEGVLPDGICLDAEDAVWVASPPSREVLRVRQGGEVIERIELEQQAFACMLGGADRTTLFVTTAEDDNPDARRAERNAKVLAIGVDVPGAGLP
ncbi:SMP-30/gluconolactonase/LRE family protein [Sphingomonas oligophenolica]